MSEVSITIKYDKGFDATWYVFRGEPDRVHADLTSTFGLDPAATELVTLHQLAAECTLLAQGLATVASEVTPRPKPKVKDAPAKDTVEPKAPESPKTTGAAPASVWDDPEPTGLDAEIESAETAEALLEIWKANKGNLTKDQSARIKVRGTQLKEKK